MWKLYSILCTCVWHCVLGKFLWLLLGVCDPSLHALCFSAPSLVYVPVWLCLYRFGLALLCVSPHGLCSYLCSRAVCPHGMWVSMGFVSLCEWLMVTILSVSGWLYLQVSVFAVAMCQSVCAYVWVCVPWVCEQRMVTVRGCVWVTQGAVSVPLTERER